MWTIDQLKFLKESEDRVEFKKGEHGNVAYDGGTRTKPNERRRCILGYVTALCNENGGSLVIGMEDKYPHKVVGTSQSNGAIGLLESNIYKDTGIRPNVYELYEKPDTKEGRVLVIDVPSRPIGKVYKFEDVALMRVGEELKPMSDEVYLKIIQEQEPDFSMQICQEAVLDDLDDKAIDVMKQKYALKQNNYDFLTLSNTQLLSDLELIKGGKITNAAIILLGREDAIRRFFPHAAVCLEYRNNDHQIEFDNRVVYCEAFFMMIERLWYDINLRNGKFQVKDGPYIYDIPYFNEDVIREAINNAVAHRDYRKNSETVIKLYPQKIVITNAGGFPLGVTINNLLTVPSTPRNRLLTDVLSKTGIVERSGQGIDKIFRNTISEGKDMPDYSFSDDFYVELRLSAVIKDKAFALFIETEQQRLPQDKKLSVAEIVGLCEIHSGNVGKVDKNTLMSLLKRGLVEKHGKTSGTRYILSKGYYEFVGNETEYVKQSGAMSHQAISAITAYLFENKKAKMKDFSVLLEGYMTRRQVKSLVDKLVEEKMLTQNGKGIGTYYEIGEAILDGSKIIAKAIDIGLDELRRRGELQ